jgi:peptidoglycan hydrolase CwlO-like protein
MNGLELKKKELELERVKLAKKEMEFKIEERLEEIDRLKSHIEIQNQTIKKIEQEIKG